MRRFSSYGPVDKDLHYYVPRKELIEKGFNLLIGEDPAHGGHYFTVWAPRQCGKTWILQESIALIRKSGLVEVAMFSVSRARDLTDEEGVMNILVEELQFAFNRPFPPLKHISDLRRLFTKDYFSKPVILVLDEFDALDESIIHRFANVFRDLYIVRNGEKDKTPGEKNCLLHGLALIGVRSVLGIDNSSGSPFNVQRNFPIPNLTFDEVESLFKCYEKESGQEVDKAVPRALYDETLGQPGLTCWFGELLTETYNKNLEKPITIENFKEVFGAATYLLPNNNILNLISKVNKPPYDEMVMDFFETGEKAAFSFDEPDINYLFTNGVIVPEIVSADEYYVKFSCPFVQKRLFNYFSRKYFDYLGQLISPVDSMKDAITEEVLFIPNIIKRYREYLKKNRDIFFKEVPRRKTDLKIYEAVYHFNLYRYLFDLLKKRGVDIIPQFPTGNGKIDLILKYQGRIYPIELKSFRDMFTFEKGIEQAADYCRQMGWAEIFYLVFVELSEVDVRQFEKTVEQNGITVSILPVSIL